MSQKPDIVLIMSDEHSPQFSSVYGHPIVRTPNMERLAEAGLTFDAAYCASPLCVPSRAAFMTGQLPSRTEVWDNGVPLRSDIPTLAHVLRKQGYETVLIGKMHFIGPDQMHGFERRLVDDSRVCGTWIESNDWNNSGEPRPGARRRITEAGAGRTSHIEQDEDVLDAAIVYIDQLRASRESRRPVFLCISFNAPHFPLRSPKYFDDYWPDNVDAPLVTVDESRTTHPFHKRLRSYFDIDHLQHEETLRARAAFYALTTWFDELLGVIIDKIDEAPLSKDAEPMLIYASDHGDMAGEHALWWKCCFFEEAVRIPMIIRWQGHVGPGTRCPDPVSLIDLSVTLAEISGALTDNLTKPFVEGSDGTSLLPIMAGRPDPKRSVISEYMGHAAARPIRMIRQQEWKYVYYHGEPDELYDLNTDPGERTNLASSPSHQTILAGLKTQLLDGWDADAIDHRVRSHQAERALIAAVEDHGTFE